MPAPVAVYVFAVVAAAGAIWAFKEFVYDPHIHPEFVRLAEERRRRREYSQPHAQHPGNDDDDDDDDDTQPLIPPQQGQQGNRRRHGLGGDHADSDEERYGSPHGRYLAPGQSSHPPTNEIELADLAPEVREWRRSDEDVNRTLRLRRNAGQTAALDESNHNISISPILPTRATQSTSGTPSISTARDSPAYVQRSTTAVIVLPPLRTPLQTDFTQVTHVIRDPDSPASSTSNVTTAASTPTGTPLIHPRRMQDLPQIPTANTRTDSGQHGASSSLLFSVEGQLHRNANPNAVISNEETPSPTPSFATLSSLVTSPPLPMLPLPRHPLGAAAPPPVSVPQSTGSLASFQTAVTGGEPSSLESTRTISPQRGSSTSSSTARPALSHRDSVSASYSTLSTMTSPSPPNMSSSPLGAGNLNMPSLSQIYPQDLDYEHGVVLLSPPSSRSESPFSVVSGVYSSPNIVGTPSPTSSNYLSLSEDGGGSSRASSAMGQQQQQQAFGSPRSSGSGASSPRGQPQRSQLQGGRGVRSPLVPGSDDEFDFDVLSSSNSDGSVSPFSMSPFMSPQMGGRGAVSRNASNDARLANDFGRTRSLSGALQESYISVVGDHTNIPTSPAVSTSSTMLSDLDFMEDAEESGWGETRGSGSGQGRERR